MNFSSEFWMTLKIWYPRVGIYSSFQFELQRACDLRAVAPRVHRQCRTDSAGHGRQVCLHRAQTALPRARSRYASGFPSFQPFFQINPQFYIFADVTFPLLFFILSAPFTSRLSGGKIKAKSKRKRRPLRKMEMRCAVLRQGGRAHISRPSEI